MHAEPLLRSHLVIHQSVAPPVVDLTNSVGGTSGVEMPSGLKQRWKPFGCSEFTRKLKIGRCSHICFFIYHVFIFVLVEEPLVPLSSTSLGMDSPEPLLRKHKVRKWI